MALLDGDALERFFLKLKGIPDAQSKTIEIHFWTKSHLKAKIASFLNTRRE